MKVSATKIQICPNTKATKLIYSNIGPPPFAYAIEGVRRRINTIISCTNNPWWWHITAY